MANQTRANKQLGRCFAVLISVFVVAYQIPLVSQTQRAGLPSSIVSANTSRMILGLLPTYDLSANTSGVRLELPASNFSTNTSRARLELPASVNTSRESLQRLLKDLASTSTPINDGDIRSLYAPGNINLTGLQPWLLEYLEWHLEMRRQFPGKQLFDNPDAPKVFIKICLGQDWPNLCAGLNDRMHLIPVYVAAKTNRVLLYYWTFPHSLEEFLVPNVIDWTTPDSDTLPVKEKDFLYSKAIQLHWNKWLNGGNKLIRNYPNLIKEQILTMADFPNFDSFVDEARNTTSEVEPDSEFATLWKLFFKPSPAVEYKLMDIMKRGGLKVNQYVATHSRTRHPARQKLLNDPTVRLPSREQNKTADNGGIAFKGKARELLIDVGTHALECVNLLRQPEERIYFYADSEDLVRYMTSNSVNNTENTLSDQRFNRVRQNISSNKIVGGDFSQKALHINLEYGPNASDYYNSFIDLYLGAAARCLSFGLGNYARLASKISNMNCRQTHERLSERVGRRWGTNPDPRDVACPIPSYPPVLR